MEISIKLYNVAIPHTELCRRVPHTMQQPLKEELDKLCREKILHNVDIGEPIEWLNNFVCVKNQMAKSNYALILLI